MKTRFVALCALFAFSCGDDEPGALQVEPGEVVRRCTRDVYASSPFGMSALVDRYAVKFEVPDTVQSFVVSAGRSGASTTLSLLQPPHSPWPIDLVLGDDLERFHPAGFAALQGRPIDVDRIMMPPAVGFEDRFGPGLWEVRGDTGSAPFCVSVAASDGTGDAIYLSVYVVGLENMTPETTATNADWQEVLGEVQRVFGAHDIRVPTEHVLVRGVDEVATVRYSLIRSWEDFVELVSESEEPSAAEGGPLRLNVFLVRGFAGGQLSGVLGIASGIPGAIGVHGTRDSGVVFGVEDYLGAPDVGDGMPGNIYLGRVMAHEIGHFLGLFHTTERTGAGDPLGDTPRCAQMFDYLNHGAAALAEGCPDAQHLMFPFALTAGGGTELSADQVRTARFNPLVR